MSWEKIFSFEMGWNKSYFIPSGGTVDPVKYNCVVIYYMSYLGLSLHFSQCIIKPRLLLLLSFYPNLDAGQAGVRSSVKMHLMLRELRSEAWLCISTFQSSLSCSCSSVQPSGFIYCFTVGTSDGSVWRSSRLVTFSEFRRALLWPISVIKLLTAYTFHNRLFNASQPRVVLKTRYRTFFGLMGRVWGEFFSLGPGTGPRGGSRKCKALRHAIRFIFVQLSTIQLVFIVCLLFTVTRTGWLTS